MKCPHCYFNSTHFSSTAENNFVQLFVPRPLTSHYTEYMTAKWKFPRSLLDFTSRRFFPPKQTPTRDDVPSSRRRPCLAIGKTEKSPLSAFPGNPGPFVSEAAPAGFRGVVGSYEDAGTRAETMETEVPRFDIAVVQRLTRENDLRYISNVGVLCAVSNFMSSQSI